ncbi:GspH/FimT family pseudopilin [Cupriavidus pauculus]|uniref:GspH/FimT family pseudopilin n=1 Tax=Cupriavidus pauculus TaxID=82633 RepID=UPI001243E557|nr:GspH/FimT family pseudopilin [Cupriavidus pauculus]KAB0598474.1 prepilin-type N-terminal cleavage/methylation domain-containing protein [Cupriavidus pauculus]MCM3608325.1 GspH/FimT family pseudopilin [Cupriavidus pauculus]UAL00476.1 GspH/FimT family pseudopilin [Cupriavidus pauculus]
MPPIHARRMRGFTLLELMITLVVGAVLVGFAVPSMSGLIRSNRVMTTANSFNSAVSKARTTAAATNSYVTVAPLGGDWKNGWQVFNEHASPNGTYEEGIDTLISESDQPPADMSITVATTPQGLGSISFSPVGYSQTAATKAQMAMTVGFAISEAQRVVEISLLGRARVCNPSIDTTTCTMP